MNIGFWKNKDNNFRSSYKGLTEEQVEFLKGLKKGDRLVIFVLSKNDGTNMPLLELTKVTIVGEIENEQT